MERKGKSSNYKKMYFFDSQLKIFLFTSLQCTGEQTRNVRLSDLRKLLQQKVVKLFQHSQKQFHIYFLIQTSVICFHMFCLPAKDN